MYLLKLSVQAKCQKLHNGKIAHLRVMVKAIVPAGRNACAVLKDPTGNNACTCMHY